MTEQAKEAIRRAMAKLGHSEQAIERAIRGSRVSRISRQVEAVSRTARITNRQEAP